MKKKFKSEVGITLIALIITVVIIILLAGISISEISGEGLISRTLSAREQAEIQGEKETIQAAVVNAKGRNRYGKLTKDELEDELNSNGNTAEVTEYMSNLLVHLTESNRYYETTKSGQVTKMEIEEANVDVAERFNNGDYTWQDIHEMAKIISGMYGSGIDRTSGEVEFIYDKKIVKLEVGDEFDLVGKITLNNNEKDYTYRVRIIGFNSDILSSDQYKDGKYEAGFTRAGITFEFTNFFRWDGMNENGQMNSTRTNVDGWGASAMRDSLNDPTTLIRLTNSTYIKTVDKLYLATYNSSVQSISQDKLWLLASSEVFIYSGPSTPKYGWARDAESEVDESYNGQYKWYKDNVTVNNGDGEAKKFNSNYNDTTYGNGNPGFWWLRSHHHQQPAYFLLVSNSGGISNGWEDSNYYISPGFCI